jgi:excisionase family DNA binding protein
METNIINDLFSSRENPTLAIIQIDKLEVFCKKLIEDTIKELGMTCESNKSESYPTINQVAELFHKTRGTLNRWHTRGILKHYEIGGRRCYRMSEVEAYMKGGRR